VTNQVAFSESGTDDSLVARIREFIERHPPPKLATDAMLSLEEFRQFGYAPRILFPIVSKSEVAKAEADFGFPFPQILKRLFLAISNGIAGFSYDIMGLNGGCASHCGTLIDGYMGFMSYGESENTVWRAGLLPFCHWGCTIFSCVDCTDLANSIFTYEDSCVSPERYTLPEFFEMWLKGKVLFSQENVEIVTKEITNPATGKRATISARRRRKPST